MSEIEQVISDSNKEKFPYIPIDSLIDVIVADDHKIEVFQKEIRVWSGIKEINECNIEVLNKKIYINQAGNCIIVEIVYELKILYTSDNGIKHSLNKTFCFNTEIPCISEKKQRLECESYCFPLNAHLYINSAECIKCEIRCVGGATYIVATIQFDMYVCGTIRKKLSVMVYMPDCKNTSMNTLKRSKSQKEKS